MNGITVTIDTTPEHAEELTRDALAAEGFGILSEVDVAATFADKLGIARPALKILGACNPGFAHIAISHDPSVALLLPCNVVIEQTDQRRHRHRRRPSAAPRRPRPRRPCGRRRRSAHPCPGGRRRPCDRRVLTSAPW